MEITGFCVVVFFCVCFCGGFFNLGFEVYMEVVQLVLIYVPNNSLEPSRIYYQFAIASISLYGLLFLIQMNLTEF